MPNPKLETYKNNATTTVYDLTDANAQARLTAILDGTSIDSFADVESALTGKFPREEQRELVAKNLLPLTNETTVIKGVTFTVYKNAVGHVVRVNINGTNDGTGNSDFPLIKGFTTRVSPESLGYETGKQYIMSGCTGGSNSTYMLMFNGSTANRFKCTDGEVTDAFVSGDLVYPEIRVVEGASVSNVDLYPMLRLATDPDPTFVPHAMTNRELTEKVTPTSTALTIIQNANFEMSGLSHFIKKMGNLCEIYSQFKCLTSNASWTQLNANIPKPFNMENVYIDVYPNGTTGAPVNAEISGTQGFRLSGGEANKYYNVHMIYICA